MMMNMEPYEEQVRRYNQMLLQMQQRARVVEPPAPDADCPFTDARAQPLEPPVPLEPIAEIEPIAEPPMQEELVLEIALAPETSCCADSALSGAQGLLAQRIAHDLCKSPPEVQDCVLGCLIRADKGFWSAVRAQMKVQFV